MVTKLLCPNVNLKICDESFGNASVLDVVGFGPKLSLAFQCNMLLSFVDKSSVKKFALNIKGFFWKYGLLGHIVYKVPS